MTETARRAAWSCLPVTSAEREGTLISGRARRSAIIPPLAARDLRADYAIAAQIGQKLGLKPESQHALAFLAWLAASAPVFLTTRA